MHQDDRLVTELRAGLKNTYIDMAGRAETIAKQSVQIRAMRDELLRAEAQLELLKDLMLDNRDEDQL